MKRVLPWRAFVVVVLARQRCRTYPKSFTSYGFLQYSGGDSAVGWYCDRRGKGKTGARSRWGEYTSRRMACMDYVGTVHRVDSAEHLAFDREPLPPQRARLSFWAEAPLLGVGYSTVGAVAASHRPGNPVAGCCAP